MSEHSLILKSPPPEWPPGCFADICERVQDAASPCVNGERLYLGLEHLASGQPSLVGRGKESDVTSGKSAFCRGDILFGKLRPYLRKSVLAPEDGICSTDILVFRATTNSCPEYLCSLTHTDEFVAHAKATTSGVQHPRTSWSALREFKLHIPPLPEQRQIAAVLRLVQRAMEQQDQLLALTAELKKALLHQLFAYGLRHESQKQTDLGPIPQSWEVRPISDLDLDIGDGNYSTKYPRQEDFLPDGVPFLRANNLVEGRLSWDDMRYISPGLHAQLRKGHTKKDDVCLVTRGNIGEVAFVTDEFVGSNMNAQLVRLNGCGHLDGKFLYFALTHPATQKQFISLKTGTALQQLPIGKLKLVRIPIPPKDEQVDIAHALWLVTEKSGVIGRKHAALSALFRTLLHELMTAQIRVHNLDLPELEAKLSD
jgi:type I restriction enzyme S subunit